MTVVLACSFAFGSKSRSSAGIFHTPTAGIKGQWSGLGNTQGLLQNKCKGNPASPDRELAVLGDLRSRL